MKKRSSPPWQFALLLMTALLLAVSCIQPIYAFEQSLQHVPTIPALVGLAVAARRSWLSNLAFGCLIMFLLLHILAARYIYSFVPYEDWCRTILGESPGTQLGWQRNHFDRFVHFSFGLLWTRPALEVALSKGGLRPAWGAAFAVCFVLSVGSLYEVGEWLLAVCMSPDQAEAYNGQQGDLWDAQKDMAMQFLGALSAIALSVNFLLHRANTQWPGAGSMRAQKNGTQPSSG